MNTCQLALTGQYEALKNLPVGTHWEHGTAEVLIDAALAAGGHDNPAKSCLIACIKHGLTWDKWATSKLRAAVGGPEDLAVAESRRAVGAPVRAAVAESHGPKAKNIGPLHHGKVAPMNGADPDARGSRTDGGAGAVAWYDLVACLTCVPCCWLC